MPVSSSMMVIFQPSLGSSPMPTMVDSRTTTKGRTTLRVVRKKPYNTSSMTSSGMRPIMLMLLRKGLDAILVTLTFPAAGSIPSPFFQWRKRLCLEILA